MVTLIFIIVLIAIDQITKYFVAKNLMPIGEKIIVPNFFRLLYVENRGAAFGILQDSRLFFIIATLIVVAFLSYHLFFRKESLQPILQFALSLILAGAIGNFIDRVRLHYVIDFLSFRILGRDFAVFNFADICIVIGTIILMISIVTDVHTND